MSPSDIMGYATATMVTCGAVLFCCGTVAVLYASVKVAFSKDD